MAKAAETAYEVTRQGVLSAVMRAHILAARTAVLQSLRGDHNAKLDTNGA